MKAKRYKMIFPANIQKVFIVKGDDLYKFHADRGSIMTVADEFRKHIDDNKWYLSERACHDVGYDAAILDLFDNHSHLFEEFRKSGTDKMLLEHCSGCGYVYDANLSERLFHIGRYVGPEFTKSIIQITSTVCHECYKEAIRPGIRERWNPAFHITALAQP